MPMSGAVAVVVVALTVGACSPGKQSGPETTVPTAAVDTTTTTVAPTTDPFAVPAVIDEAYVNRVLAALDAVDGAALREVVAAGSVNAAATASLRSIYNDPLFDVEANVLLEDFAGGLQNIRRPPGDRRTVVTRLVSAGQSCIFAEVSMDFSAVANVVPEPKPAKTTVVSLEPTQAGADLGGLNPTPWSYNYTDVVDKGAAPREQPCAG